MSILRRFHLHLLVIGAIKLVAGQEAANRYIDRIELARAVLSAREEGAA